MENIYTFKNDVVVKNSNYKHLIKKGANATIVEYKGDNKVCVILVNDPFKEKIIVDKAMLI